MRKFQNLMGFEKLNPINDFDFDEKFDQIKSIDNIELFKKAMDEHKELKEVIWIAIYHSLNTFDAKHEYLTVLNKNFHLIADLVEGDDRSVEIPTPVKKEIVDGNVLATFHNHFKGAILPSSNDLKNTIIPFIKFMVITSNENIGIIVNNFEGNLIDLFKQEWIMYISFLTWSFNNQKTKEVQEIYNSKLSKIEKEKEEQMLFDEYLGENLTKFIDEFNLRMEKYNVYFLQILIKER